MTNYPTIHITRPTVEEDESFCVTITMSTGELVAKLYADFVSEAALLGELVADHYRYKGYGWRYV